VGGLPIFHEFFSHHDNPRPRRTLFLMKTITTIFMVIVALTIRAQTTTTTGGGATTTTTSQQQQRTISVPANDNGMEPPGRAFNSTNPPRGRPFKVLLNTNQAQFQDNQFTNTMPRDQIDTSGQTSVSTTNSFGSNGVTSSQTVNATITNTLSAMSPVQANNVIQVQAGLNALQQVAINLGGVQNVQQVIQQNPQIQTQLQKVEAQISMLAQGPAKPSGDIVARLSQDLLVANARAQLSPDQQLIIAVIINQAVNSENLNAGQIESAINTALANLQQAGIPRSVSHTVACDLHSIAFELQPNLRL
jgi:hypothetical protein